MDYLREPEAITRQSFALIEAEADLSAFAADERALVVRLIHACGMPDIAADLVVSRGAVAVGRAALAAGAALITDVEMVRHGIIAGALPASNEVLCAIAQPAAASLARERGTTRAAAAVETLKDRIGGAVLAIGTAPTALFRLLEGLDEGWPRPALILGFPVGFVGAAEAKAALAEDPRGVPFITLPGRRGGAALAAAAVNALAATDAP